MIVVVVVADDAAALFVWQSVVYLRWRGEVRNNLALMYLQRNDGALGDAAAAEALLDGAIETASVPRAVLTRLSACCFDTPLLLF